MSTLSSANSIHFPPAVSARITAEIEAIAWNETDLLGDIPEDDPDAMYLADLYAEQAASRWEEANDLPEAYLPYRIIDAARRSLVTRINAEIVRRERIVEREYRRRLRGRSIDVNGVGDVPSYYGMIDEQLASPPPKLDMTSGRESDRPGPFGQEVLIMSEFKNKGVVKLWHFECAECGFSDEELGGPGLTGDSIYCQVCLEDGHVVRLSRWPADEFVPDLRAA